MLPNPFTSIDEFIPKSRLEPLREFACYQSYWSSLHHVAFLDEGRITEAFEAHMEFFNDVNGWNLFTLAIIRNNVNMVLDVMKNLSIMLQSKLAPIQYLIPLKDIIRKNNAYVEPLIKDAMVPAISDRGSPPPSVYNQAEDKILYALSPQNRYNDEVHQKLHQEKKESKFQLGQKIEIKTFVFTYLFPDRFTEECIELKEATVECNRKEVFRTTLI